VWALLQVNAKQQTSSTVGHAKIKIFASPESPLKNVRFREARLRQMGLCRNQEKRSKISPLKRLRFFDA
jgi:hypothetical protein